MSVERLIAGLSNGSWAVTPDFLELGTCRMLAREIRAASEAGELQAAGVGKGREHRIRPEVRSDFVLWLEEERFTSAQAEVWGKLQELRQELNRSLFLGLRSFEGHVTLYPPGGHYARHVDNFRGTSGRVLSCILYLNEGWRPEDGGQLRMFADEESETPLAVVEPEAGTLALFLSREVPHEVVPAKRERLSLTGWFLDR